jgi:DNA helicase-2/ATP-dependent DNA helicase PcrA
MDFEDLLLNTNELLYSFTDVLAKYNERFRYIMVDEYQDTNHSQYLIVKSLAAKFENLCVVGDDAQSIYAFRGANIRNILNFQKDYPDAEIFKLEQNYRSTKHIVQAANSIIKKNKDQLEKDVWTHNDEGEKIIVHKAISDTDEGNYVAQRIWDTRMQEHLPFDSFCILYRTNAQSRSFEDALRKKNIPYRIFGGLSFYQRKEIKDLMAYFRLAINANDEEALRRVINYPARGIGATTMDKMTVMASEKGISLWEVASTVHQTGITLNNPTKQRILDFVTQIKSYTAMLDKGDAFDVAAHIAKNSKLIHTLGEDKTPEGIGRYENIQELLNGIKDFSEQQKQIEDGDASLGSYLQDIALLTDSDAKDDGEPKVALMTIHLAKGLEFPYVYIVGMEENLFPSMMSVNSRSELEEERRLFYVALTRAETRAYLTYAHTRYRWGKVIDCEPSRFIKDIDERHLDIQVPEFSPAYNPASDELSNAFGGGVSFSKPRRFTNNGGGFQRKQEQPVRKPNPAGMKKVSQATGGNSTMPAVAAGDRVLHDRFGLGNVEEIVGEGASKKAVVMFDNAGKKNLLLKFAKLQKV